MRLSLDICAKPPNLVAAAPRHYSALPHRLAAAERDSAAPERNLTAAERDSAAPNGLPAKLQNSQNLHFIQ
jgi:hypothetical protein